MATRPRSRSDRRRAAPVGIAAAALASLAVAAPAGAEIGRANLDGSGVEPALIAIDPQAVTLDVAVGAEHIYWTWAVDRGGEDYQGWIGRANLDGSGVEPKLIPGPGVGALAVGGDHVYWSDSEARTIGRADLDGSDVEPRFITAAGERPFDVEADGKHVYWATDNGEGAPLLGWIGRARLNGNEVERRLIGPISLGSNRALAIGDEHVYFTAGIDVLRANLDGSGAPTCPTPVDACTPTFLSTAAFDLAVDDAHVYYSGSWPAGDDLITGIGRAGLDGSGLDPLRPLIAPPAYPVMLALDAEHVYWTSGPVRPDREPPQTTITKRAPHRLHGHRVRLRFASSEPGSTFECRLDGRPYRPCTSPRTLRHLDDGRHRFKVIATDAAGNVDPSPAKDRFRVVGSA